MVILFVLVWLLVVVTAVIKYLDKANPWWELLILSHS